ncbi:MAG: hypothetical protein ACT4TC_17115, partial [Myxococcaceae bacterium]
MAQPKRKEKSSDVPSSPTPEAVDGPWERPAGLTWRGWLALGAVVVLINVPLIHYELFRGPPDAFLSLSPTPAAGSVSRAFAADAAAYTDDFARVETVKEHYWSSGGLWRVVAGTLLSPGVKNNPLWLKAKLPRDAAVEFDVRSESPEGDIKVELFGDGSDHASGYVFIHGGWNNSISIIARLDEHGEPYPQLQARAQRVAKERGLPVDASVETLRKTGVFRPDSKMRVEANPFPVQIGKMYHWRIERRG